MRADLAFLFPGQGSQRIGMLAEAAAEFSEVRDTFAEASSALGYDLGDLILRGDEQTLNLTEYTQPALLAASVALWRAWQAQSGAVPARMAGHSLGEFSALCCAGALTLADAVCLVRERGRFMQTAVPVGEGAMAAVLGLDDNQVQQVCDHTSTELAVVQAVNFNAPGQVVIAGHSAAVEAAINALKEAGAKRAMALPVSAPFHTSLMQPAGDKLRAVLDTITLSPPSIPVVHNVHAQSESDPQRIRELLVKQISSPVRWTACMATLQDAGITQLVECGPGKVLGGLHRRIDKSASCCYLEQPADLRAALAELA